MRKLSLFFALVLIAFAAKAQEEDSETNSDDFDHWSLELQGGFSLLGEHSLEPGYDVKNPNFWQGNVGVRYMPNEYFGFRFETGYHSFQNSRSSENEFDSGMLSAGLHGVINAGTLLNFRDWTNTIGLLIHAGVNYGTIASDKPRDISFFKDNLLYSKIGVTPQFRLSDRLALTTDVSMLRSMRQDLSLDGTTTEVSRNLRQLSIDASVGLTYYFGNKKHADWHSPDKCNCTDRIDELDEGITGIRDDMKDSDNDGVPDYLDEEPDTPEGAVVDTKGRTVERVPDELREELDRRYDIEGGDEAIRKLINDGYVNVYFRFDSAQPEQYSLEAVNYLVKYLNENENTDVELVGYADELGESDYNTKLSETRAERVRDILIANGIDESRLSTSGQGSDSSVDKDSEDARQMVRRVRFRLQD